MEIEYIDVVLDSSQVGVSNYVSGTRDNPIFTMNPPITECVGASLIYATVPFSYYIIDNTNCRFEFRDSAQSASYFTCSLSFGSFTDKTIEGEMRAAMERAGLLNSTNFGIYIDETEKKMVIQRTVGTATFDIRFTVSGNCASVLGFQQTTYNSDNLPYYDNFDFLRTYQKIEAPLVANFTGPNIMYVESSFGANIFGKVRTHEAQNSLLDFFSVNTIYGGTIEYNNVNPVRKPFSSTDITQISLRLQLGNRKFYQPSTAPATDYLQLNGEPFQVAIRFYRVIPSTQRVLDALGNSSWSSQTALRASLPSNSMYSTSTVFPTNF